MKNINHAGKETRKEQADRLKGSICEMLKCTDMQYGELQYEQGLKYLKHYLPSDDHSADSLSRSRVFWNWWKNHWTNRDESFKKLITDYPVRDREIVRQLYAQYNCGKALADSIHPHSTVLNESYAIMIQDLIENETAQA